MDKNLTSFLKDVPYGLWILITILCAIILVGSFMAVSKGCSPTQPHPEVRVYLNEDDSTIIRLQQDVKELKQYIKDIQEDSIEVVIRRVKKSTDQ